VFLPENLLREARRQKSLSWGSVPRVCVLDPDGDIVRMLKREKRARRDPAWACYHTELFRFELKGRELGIIGCAVGASFAVLLAEQLFASGCELLISVTSSGQIDPELRAPCFVLIEKALRDEGTSYHYMPPSDFSRLLPALSRALRGSFGRLAQPVLRGSTWTTDAPYRETAGAIESCRRLGIAAVEMEAAALYAFSRAKRKPVVCLAHVTNQMARVEGDFEKGRDNGAHDALAVVAAVARKVGVRPRSPKPANSV
jgi:uridine phosphorylase